MFIESVTLVNIRSYALAEVHFHKGVNFISGRNGAGKTTIIEAIGWALFGAAPAGTIEENLRYGTKKGEIAVAFSIENQRFRVVKKIGTANSRRLYDGRGDELNLHGEKDVNDFIKELLHLSTEEDLSALFNDVIGVRQGSFTQPFAEAAGDRKRIFNKVLRLDSYAKAERNGSELKRLTESKLHELDKAYALYSLTAEEEEPTRLSLEDVEGNIRIQVQSVESEHKEQSHAQAEVNVHKAAKEALLSARGGDALAQVERKALETAAAVKAAELSNAHAAKEALKQLHDSYTAYLLAKEKDTKLNARRIERDGMDKRKTALDSAISTEEKALELEEKSVIEIIVKNSLLQKQSEEALVQLTEQKRQVAQSGQILQSKQSEHEQVFLKLKAMEISIKNFNKLKENLSLGRAKYNGIEENIADIQKRLLRENEINNRYERLQSAEKTEQEAAKALAGALQKLHTLQKDHERFQSGRCPYTAAPCDTVGSLEQDTALKIKALQEEILALQAQEKAAVEHQQECKDARKEHALLEEARNRLCALNIERESCSKAFAALFEMAGKIELPGTSILSFHAAAAALMQAFAIERLESAAASMDQAYEEAEQTVLELREKHAAQEKLLTEHATALSADTKRIESELLRVSKELETAKAELQHTATMQSNIEKRKETLVLRCIEREDLEAILTRYSTLEAEIESVRKSMTTNESAYNQYLGQSTLAQKLPELEAEWTSLQAAQSKAAETARSAKAELEFAEKAYHPEAELAAQERLRSACDRLATAQERLRNLQERKEETLQKLQRILSAKALKEETEGKAAAMIKTQGLMNLCLKVLKNAGERMALFYRERLSIEADRLYRAMSAESAALQWTDDYDIRLIDTYDGRERRRVFRQLSGGEQMTAALSLRLALLTQLTSAGLAFFDEPTTNLDAQRRSLLADVIPAVTKEFEQIFVVSHDDTFDSITENVISLRRGKNGTELDTRV